MYPSIVIADCCIFNGIFCRKLSIRQVTKLFEAKQIHAVLTIIPMLTALAHTVTRVPPRNHFRDLHASSEPGKRVPNNPILTSQDGLFETELGHQCMFLRQCSYLHVVNDLSTILFCSERTADFRKVQEGRVGMG